MVNGTGVPASKYTAIFEHLASWGFIVIGNEDANSADGLSGSMSLEFLLQLNSDTASIFCNKIAVDRIGIAGHSQGGVGAVNAVTNYENGSLYKVLYTASMPHPALANELKWSYDVSQIHISYFSVAGTEKIDAETIAPLPSLIENYNAVSDETIKLIARRSGADHGEMLYLADAYMTAWFMYFLQSDEDAGNIFFGDTAEILFNQNWQNIEKNN